MPVLLFVIALACYLDVTATVQIPVANGTAASTAAGDGKPGTAFVKVMPPQSPGLVFQDDFESGKYDRSQPGGAWVGGGSGNVHVGPGGASGSSYALSLIHRAKPSAGMSTAEQRFKLSKGVPELWIQYDFLVPSNYYHRFSTDARKSDNNKFLALWEENYNGRAADRVTPTPVLVLELRPMNDALSHPGEVGSSYLYVHGHDRTGKLVGRIGSPWLLAFGSWNRGKWVQIRVHVKLATDDSKNDGVIEVYADQKPVIRVQNFSLHSTAAGHYIRNGYLMGWSNSGYDQDTHFKIDNLKMYATNPGW